MKNNDPIKNYMTKDLITITTQTKLSEARKIFLENKIHHLPVVSGDNKLEGILSYNDLLRVDSGTLYNQDAKQADALIDNMCSVEEAMTSSVESIKSTNTVREATEILHNGKFHSLPVVEDAKVVGLVTSTDLLKYFLNQY